MQQKECDFSPMKKQLKEDLRQIITEIKESIKSIEDEHNCLLGKFEQIKEHFINIESTAATFYLNCYLAPFTDKYLDLSISIQHLSERRHGALIVVERHDPLESFIQKGVQLNAIMTHSLLESIFYPGNPLHDGAVLIKKNQIVSAANVLPLANYSLIKQQKMGTRHRAALGLTERCDAIVLIVSEETGRASFASKGKIYPIITP